MTRVNTQAKKTSGTKGRSSKPEDIIYFNSYLHATGYLNAVRVTSKFAGKENVSVTFAELRGPSNNIVYRYYDLLVTKEELRELIKDHRDSIEDRDTSVFVSIRVSDPTDKPFIYDEESRRAGELGVNRGGFLYRIVSMKIDNELVYEYEQDEG